MTAAAQPSAPASAAARWWAAFLTRTAPQDNGDPSSMGGIVAALSVTVAARAVYTPEQAARFEQRLAELINEKLTRSGKVWVGVDYDPDPLLRRAFNLAGLPMRSFALPMKSTSVITPELVLVSTGYGGTAQRIWPVEPR